MWMVSWEKSTTFFDSGQTLIECQILMYLQPLARVPHIREIEPLTFDVFHASKLALKSR